MKICLDTVISERVFIRIHRYICIVKNGYNTENAGKSMLFTFFLNPKELSKKKDRKDIV